jgi:hypothetical protein
MAKPPDEIRVVYEENDPLRPPGATDAVGGPVAAEAKGDSSGSGSGVTVTDKNGAISDPLAALEGDWATRLQARFGATSWWAISAVVHVVLLLLVGLVAVALPPPQPKEVVFRSDVNEARKPEYEEKKKRDVFRSAQEVRSEQDHPLVVFEQAEVLDHFETADESDLNSARGSEDAISDIPLGGTGTGGSPIGVGGGGLGEGGGSLAGCFGYRDGGGRKMAVARFGGSDSTESAVAGALKWLADNQEPDGSWDAVRHGARHGGPRGDNRCSRVGCTGLALLAFLGAGHTGKSPVFGDTVRRAQQWLVSKQRPDGGIFEREADAKSDRIGQLAAAGYNHAIAGLALAEAYGMGQENSLAKPAQKAVSYSTRVHQQGYSGWRYIPQQAADTSVTGWFVMQLKSARLAGLKVDGAGFQGAQAFIDRVCDAKGRACYGADKRADATPSMTAVAMVCRQFMGTPPSDPLLIKGADWLLQAPPNPAAARPDANILSTGDRGFYYYYYGTLAMFQTGGDRWKRWNESMKNTLLGTQCRGGDRDGSWDPVTWTDNHGGRVFTTAVGAMCLEVYYRYLPMYAQ